MDFTLMSTSSPRTKSVVFFFSPSINLAFYLCVLVVTEGMLNPPVSSKGMVQYRASHKEGAPNKFQDIWVWNGRPNWDEIFKVKAVQY